MGRSPKARTLFVWMNGERVGQWTITAKNVQEFTYAKEWAQSEDARPISLSMPIGPRGTAYKGSLVDRFFENLLPDSKDIRQRLRQRFGALSDKAFDLLTEIGRDCIGAIQLTTDDRRPSGIRSIKGTPIDGKGIAELLNKTVNAPSLGRIADDDGFRISLAGAQEKTALLRLKGKWMLPHGATPTTHILKLPIGKAAQGIDLQTSVENEWLCSQILKAYGVATAHCWMDQFGDQKTLVVERFDRRMATNGLWIIRLPQEDFCQVTGTDRDHKYEADGGPGIEKIMNLLLGSAQPEQDRLDFFRTQIIFWMLCAIDGHAKNFSIFMEAGGQYRLTPRYDVLSAFPVLGKKSGQLSPHNVKMAMAVRGDSRKHYHWDTIQLRHWKSLGKRCGISTQFDSIVSTLIQDTPKVITEVSSALPRNFPPAVQEPILKGLRQAAQKLTV
jgi:serine/threonine-protein kinase HipA